MAVKFVEHYFWIASSMTQVGGGAGMWDDEDGFFYDVLRLPNGQSQRLKVRSMVGLLPLCAATVFDGKMIQKHPDVVERLRHFADARPELTALIHDPSRRGLNDRLLAGCSAVIERYGLPGYAVGVGAKGCVTFSPQPIVDYESFIAHQDVAVTDLAWVYNTNRGIFMTPGREEEWTLSVTHTDEAVDAYVQVFDEMAAELTA